LGNDTGAYVEVVGDGWQGYINNVVVEDDHKCSKGDTERNKALSGAIGYVDFIIDQISVARVSLMWLIVTILRIKAIYWMSQDGFD